MSLAKDPQAAWQYAAYTVCRNGPAFGQSVRNERWRYSEFTGGSGGAVLFDHENDPHEMRNLANDAKYKETVTDMKRLLAKLPPQPN